MAEPMLTIQIHAGFHTRGLPLQRAAEANCSSQKSNLVKIVIIIIFISVSFHES